MIKQSLIATALIVGLAAPAFAADNGHHERSRNGYQQARYNGYTAQVYHPRYASPRARYEQRPMARQGYVWQPGYYQYDNGQQYNWIPGQYIQQPYADAQYQPLNWQLLNGLWTPLGSRRVSRSLDYGASHLRSG